MILMMILMMISMMILMTMMDSTAHHTPDNYAAGLGSVRAKPSFNHFQMATKVASNPHSATAHTAARIPHVNAHARAPQPLGNYLGHRPGGMPGKAGMGRAQIDSLPGR